MNVRFTWFAAGPGAMAVVFWLLGSGVRSVLPLLVLLACPLMMLVMMRGMSGMHGGDGEDHTGHGCEHDPTRRDDQPNRRPPADTRG